MKNILFQILDKYYFFMTICSVVLIPVLSLFPWDNEGRLQYKLKNFICILTVGLFITVGMTYIKISYVQVPNVEGLQYDLARSVFLENDLECKVISGDGVVVEQSIPKDIYVKKGSVIDLTLGAIYINYSSYNSIEECLEHAEKFYNQKQYDNVIKIYQHDYLSQNAIALNNLGYLYSKGLGVEKDDTEAKKYYLLAFEAGEKTGLSNYIVNNIISPHYLEDVLDALKLGYQYNEENTVRFVEAIIMDVDLRKYKLNEVNDFFKLDDDTKIDILKKCMYEEGRIEAYKRNFKEDRFHILYTVPKKEVIGHQTITYIDENNDTGTIVENVYGITDELHFMVFGLKYDWKVDEEIFISTYSLSSAQMKLELKHYEEATQIYLTLLESEPNNSTALCNLGYIFEHGLGTPIDLDKAWEYYSKAIENGNKQALHNLLALELMSDKSLDMFASIIWYGIEQEDGNICRFIAASICQNEDILEEAAIRICQDIETIDSDCIWGWKETGEIMAYNTLRNTNNQRYILIKVGVVGSGEKATPYKLYLKEERICPYIHLLEAGFDKV